MPENKNSSNSDIPFVFLKWLVTVLSVVMVLGFLFLVTILGIKIFNLNTTTQYPNEQSNIDVLIPEGKFESIELRDNLLTIVVKVSTDQLEVSVIDIKNGKLLNQFSIKQKKRHYNK